MISRSTRWRSIAATRAWPTGSRPHHPSIVRQLEHVLKVGRAAGIPVSVCGEMASESLSAVLLLGLGYDRLSVSPPALPLVKWVVRTVPEPAARRAAESALSAASAGEVSETLRSVVGRVHRRPAPRPDLGVARPGAGG